MKTKIYMGIPLNPSYHEGTVWGVVNHKQIFFDRNHNVLTDTQHRKLQRKRCKQRYEWLNIIRRNKYVKK